MGVAFPPRESWYTVSVRRGGFIAPRSPVEGLRRRNLSFLPVFAQAVAGVAPAGAMSVIPALVFPGLVFGTNGPNLVLTFAVAMAVMVLVALCLRPIARRMAAVSGLYSYTAKGLGQRTAITAGWSAIFGYLMVAMASLLLVGVYIGQLFTNLGVALADSKVFTTFVVLAAALAAGFLMVRGIRLSAWFTVLMESLSIAVLAVLLIVYFGFHPSELDLGNLFAGNGSLDSLPTAVIVAVSAFVGFESPTTLGGEARKPFITVPRAITWTPVLMGVLCLLAVTAQDAALKGASPEITGSPTPLSDLFSQTSPISAAVLDLGIAASWFGCVIASVNALARIFFCMGREGVAPGITGRTHPVFQTPFVAIMVAMPIVAAVPVGVIFSSANPEQGLVALFTMGSYGYLGSYLLASASMPFFLRRIGESTYGSWVLATVTTLALVALLFMSAAVSIRAATLQIIIFAGFVLASVIYATFLRVRFPGRLASVGIYDETRELDLFPGRRKP